MQSKTSFFNKTALKKDILRYCPIWALYILLLLLTLFGMMDYDRATMGGLSADILKAMAWINLFYGGACGIFLLMDLFNSRLCNALHAFPMRREGWLTTHIISGVLFSLIPNLLVTAIGALLLWEYAYIALVWLAISMMQYLFFFGTAVLAATCAGNLLGSVAVYGIIHFATLFAGVVVQLLYQPLLYGVRLNMDLFYHFFPLQELSAFDYVKVEVIHSETISQLRYEGLEGEAWRYAGLCAVAGVLALLLARAVYRRRDLESAGDFISLHPLVPVFLVVCTLGAGAFLYMFSGLVGSETYLFLILGMILGYFAGKMLLERTLKVFGKKSLQIFGLLIVIIGSTLCLTWIDPLGITTYIPKTESVESVSIYGADKNDFWYMTQNLVGYSRTLEDSSFQMTDPGEIEELQDFHRQLIGYRPAEEDGVLCDVCIAYKLKNGKTVTRYYEVGRDTHLGQKAGKYFNDMRYVFEVNDTAALYNAFDSVTLDIYDEKESWNFAITDKQELAGLLNAIAADCEAGVMAQNWAYHSEIEKNMWDGYINFSATAAAFEAQGWDTSNFYLHIYPDSVNTVAYIEELLQRYLQEQPSETDAISLPE